MEENQRFWIIGHKPDFDYIIIGENTGPYSEFPDEKFSKRIEGSFHSIGNYVSQIEGKPLKCIKSPAFSKCPYLDELNSNVRESHKSFESEKDVIEYIRKLAEPFLNRAHLLKKILDDFSVEGLTPH